MSIWRFYLFHLSIGKAKARTQIPNGKISSIFFFALRSKTEEPISTFGSVDIYFIFRIFYKWVLFKPFTNHMKYFHLFAKIWQFAVVVGIVVGSLLTISTITMFIHTHTHTKYITGRAILLENVSYIQYSMCHINYYLLATCASRCPLTQTEKLSISIPDNIQQKSQSFQEPNICIQLTSFSIIWM